MLISKVKPLPYNVSKIQRVTALLSVEELQSLFSYLKEKLGTLYFYRVGSVLKNSSLSEQEMVALYEVYLKNLKEGQELMPLSCALTLDPLTLYKIDVEGGEIAKLLTPSVQILSNAICYLPDLHMIKEKVYGKELIPWGLQCTYPQLFQDSETHRIYNALVECANGILFKEIQRWLRNHTHPTCFATPQGELKTALRLGPACYQWIEAHPQLIEAKISVRSRTLL